VQQHFGRPGNRFWPTLYKAGFTPHLFHPSEQYELLKLGCGITNVVARATTAADELTDEELIDGGRILEQKVLRYKPSFLAIVGIGAYRTAFRRPKAKMGLQDERIGDARIWVLPNPSGLNANYRPDELMALYAELRNAAEALWIKRRSSHETKRAMFRAAVVVQYANESQVTRDRIVASFLFSGGVAPEVIRAIEGSQKTPFADAMRGMEAELEHKGMAFGSKEHLESVRPRPLEPSVLTAFNTVMHRQDDAPMTLLEFLLEMMRNDPELTANLAAHDLDEAALRAILNN
jgi:TDG/mug DNA glycosylase family protein